MQINEQDGGCAFPWTSQGPGGETSEVHFGMTVRDWFAGQVLSAVFARGFPKGIDADYMLQHGADHIYAVADAMILAREANPSVGQNVGQESPDDPNS